MAKGAVLERVSSRAAARNIPLEVILEITHRCNLPCKHCYLPDHDDHGELSFDEICRLFDQLAEAGTLFLSLTGGEVCTRRDFLEIVDAGVARGFAVKVLTNATMITDEIAARLAAAGVLELSVSVYGATAEVHDQVTDLPGSFARTLAGIERALAHGIHVTIKTPLLTDNGAAAGDMLELARRMSVPCKFDITMTPQNNGNLGPLQLQLQQPAMVALMSSGPLAEVLNPSFDDGPGPGPCNAGRSYCGISPVGDVVPCLMMPVAIGNLRERSFAEIWSGSALLNEVRAVTFESLTTCRSCDVKSACTRCTGLAMMRGQGVNGCDLSAKPVARARVAARRLTVIT
jgi:radical SAM protein with 4Fe4S-binding SPASM domain